MNAHWFAGLAVLVVLACGSVRAETATLRGTNVDISYERPETFVDIGGPGVLVELATYLQRRAAARLQSGERLDVVITRIDRAGRYEPWRLPPGNNVRIVRDIYPARIDLRFVLVDAGGTQVAAGARRLRDPYFLWRPDQHPGDHLRFEKALLDDWLERELKPPAPH